MPVYSECEYGPDQKIPKEIGSACRGFLTALKESGDPKPYLDRISILMKESGEAEVRTSLSEPLEDYLRNILAVKTSVRLTKDGRDYLEDVSLHAMLCAFSGQNGHRRGAVYCRFHQFDVLTHCVITALRTLESPLEDDKAQARLFVTALVHDMGKAPTQVVKKNGISFPSHCLYGAARLREMWCKDYGTWFTESEWELMSDTVLYHMCTPCHDTAIAVYRALPPKLQENMKLLHKADKAGDVPYGPICHPTKQWNGDVSLANLPLRGVIFMLVGYSGQGKTTLAKYIAERLTAMNVPVRVFTRDLFMLEVARTIDELATAQTAFDIVAREGKSREVSSLFREAVNSAINQGLVAVVDTMGLCYRSRTAFVPPNHALRIAVFPVRKQPVTEEDGRRHGMTREVQVKVAGLRPTILDPFGFIQMGEAQTDYRPVSALRDDNRAKENPCTPHFNVLTSHHGLPNGLLDHVVHEVVPGLCTGNGSDHMETYIKKLAGAGATSESFEDTVARIADHFRTLKYHVRFPMTPHGGGDWYEVMIIKYMDGVNRLWSELWCLQGRSCIVCFNKVTGGVHVIYAMPRGPEVITYPNQGVETQDLRFEKNGKEIPMVFEKGLAEGKALLDNAGSPEAGTGFVVSAKKDGLAFRLICLTENSPFCPIWGDMLNTLDNPVLNLFRVTSLQVSDGQVLMIPASNGTAFCAGPDDETTMWMMSALLLYSGVPYGDLSRENYLGLLEAALPAFIRQAFQTYRDNFDGTNCMMYFEALGGPDRGGVGAGAGGRGGAQAGGG